MILTETVHLKPHGNQIKYFKERGYEFSPHEEIDVKVEDLPPKSGVRIEIACDICGHKKTEKLSQYKKMVSRGNYYACVNCRMNKVQATNLERYGGVTPFASKEVWDKALDTMREKYGCEYATQNEDIRNKIATTNLEKYGCKAPIQNEEIKNKTINTVMERYGCINPGQIKEVREKVKNTVMEKYGVTCTLLIPEVRDKATQSQYKAGLIPSSKQQRYLCNLYGGILNYPVGYYSVDILLPDYNVIIEYNGSGHTLGIHFGDYTKEEYTKKENERYKFIRDQNYKQIFIISQKDYLPQDEILRDMLEKAISLFSNEHCYWVKYDIDNGTTSNSLKFNEEPYDFGNLRKIKKEA